MNNNDEDTYDALAQSIDQATNDSSSIVSGSIKDIANIVHNGTDAISHAVAVSDEGQMPDMKMQVKIPTGYVMQAPQVPATYLPQAMPESGYESVLTRLQRLRA